MEHGRTKTAIHFLAARSNSAIKPSVVCSFASTAGSSFKARMALLVSGPMDASFSLGNCFTSFGKSKRAWKCSTVELLVNVTQSAPSMSSRSPALVGSSVSATVW